MDSETATKPYDIHTFLKHVEILIEGDNLSQEDAAANIDVLQKIATLTHRVWVLGQICIWGGFALTCSCLFALCFSPLFPIAAIISLFVFAAIGGIMMLSAPLMLNGIWLWGVTDPSQCLMNAVVKAIKFSKAYDNRSGSEVASITKSFSECRVALEKFCLENNFIHNCHDSIPTTGTQQSGSTGGQQSPEEKPQRGQEPGNHDEVYLFRKIAKKAIALDGKNVDAGRMILLLALLRVLMTLLAVCGYHNLHKPLCLTGLVKTCGAVDDTLEAFGAVPSQLR
ncbi:MAG: hypothetical protein LBB38_04705 [Puniceicoccales bacterium]|jgi:hypothetical protein|nr:hypothetical protein [Puniceicoccales bacterium]